MSTLGYQSELIPKAAEHKPAAAEPLARAEGLSDWETKTAIKNAMAAFGNLPSSYEYEDIVSYPLPIAELPAGINPEERQHIAYAELEKYKRILSEPEFLRGLDLTDEPRTFKPHAFFADNEASLPIYGETALLSPHQLLVIDFLLDKDGYATDAKAFIAMSQSTGVLMRRLSYLIYREKQAA
jgi:hypothetical protein